MCMTQIDQSPGEFTRQFTTTEGWGEVRSLSLFPDVENVPAHQRRKSTDRSPESDGEFTRVFNRRETGFSMFETDLEQRDADCRRMEKLFDFDSNDKLQATQIIQRESMTPEQKGEPCVSLDRAAPKDPVTEVRAAAPNSTSGEAIRSQGASVSVGFVMLLLCGLTVCLHLEALFILLVTRR